MRSLTAMVLIFGVLAAVQAPSPGQSKLDETAELIEEYRVYNAVIRNMFADNKITFDFGGKVPVKLLVIEERTVFDPSVRDTPRATSSDMITSYDEMRADYQLKNQRPATLKRMFTLTVDYELVNSPESKRAAYEREGGEVHGIVSLSRVGFNKTRTEAFIYMSYTCGGLCGHGFMFWVEKAGDTWKVKKSVLMWIS